MRVCVSVWGSHSECSAVLYSRSISFAFVFLSFRLIEAAHVKWSVNLTAVALRYLRLWSRVLLCAAHIQAPWKKLERKHKWDDAGVYVLVGARGRRKSRYSRLSALIQFIFVVVIVALLFLESLTMSMRHDYWSPLIDSLKTLHPVHFNGNNTNQSNCILCGVCGTPVFHWWASKSFDFHLKLCCVCGFACEQSTWSEVFKCLPTFRPIALKRLELIEFYLVNRIKTRLNIWHNSDDYPNH